MCSIAGRISYERYLNPTISLIQQHRGPNDLGQHFEELNGKCIHLIHNRLSIIDLSIAGHQPMISDDGNAVLIYNGEIYNFESLRTKHLAHEPFHSRCDTEVVLRLYQKLGITFVKELNGDFAMAILDKRLNKLFLIRDHFGVKPLYYISNGTCFAFASEIKALIAFGIPPKLNVEGLSNYFVFKYSPLQETLFAGIVRLPPSHYLEYDIPSGVSRIERYWKVTKISLPENVEQLRSRLYELIKEAVEIRLMSDVPLGTFFSGGLDSSIIASFLKNKSEITHYTARKSANDLKKEGTTSDYEFAQKLGKDWQMRLVPIDIGSEVANPDLIRTIAYFSDDLIADGSQIPSFLITKEASKSSVVILSGMGADELFCGYKGHQLALLAKYTDHLPAFFKKPLFSYLSDLKPGVGYFKAYKRHLKTFGNYQSYDKAKFGLFSIVGDYTNALSVLNQASDTPIEIINSYFENENSVFDNLFQFELDNFLVKNLHYVDRMCMANSMEGRVPFLDYRLVEFAFSLPVKMKLSPSGKTKLILKETFNDILPTDLIRRRKAGFGMPLRSILSSRKKVDGLLDYDLFNGLGHFSVDSIHRIINNHVDGMEDNSALMFALISFQYWYKMWIDASTHPTA